MIALHCSLNTKESSNTIDPRSFERPLLWVRTWTRCLATKLWGRKVVQILSVRSSVNSSRGTTTVIDIELSVVTYCLCMISPSDSESSVVERNFRAASDPRQLAQCAKYMCRFLLSMPSFKDVFFSRSWMSFKVCCLHRQCYVVMT
jgi:hypothetical protein